MKKYRTFEAMQLAAIMSGLYRVSLVDFNTYRANRKSLIRGRKKNITMRCAIPSLAKQWKKINIREIRSRGTRTCFRTYAD